MSSRVLAAIARHARQRPQAIALEACGSRLGYAGLQRAIDELAKRLQRLQLRTLGLLADNGLAWALTDLAALQLGLRLVPLPPFFSPRQMLHALADAGVEALLAEPRFALGASLPLVPGELVELGVDGAALVCLRAPAAPAAGELPPGTCKVTYTSGTTGEPKGVCLDLDAMERVAEVLAEASEAGTDHRHLAVLPLSTLLENIGGLYAPLLRGATACLWPLEQVGLRGASGIDARLLHDALHCTRASSAILVPQLLQALVELMEQGAPRLERLRFVAVGGAPVAPRLLQRAQALGLPVFEGYGLSECASVVALNTRAAGRIGSVGRRLPHVQLAFADDGEILVRGNAFLGYVGEPPRDPAQWLATGDVGHVDAEGFLWLSGRKKNMFVTAFGRNVAPEWVERELCLQPVIAQAAVFGEARPWNVAVVVPRRAASGAAIAEAIRAVNAGLPDYARVRRWLVAAQPFLPANEQLTANGRLRRAQILRQYGDLLDALYTETLPEQETHEFL